MNKEQKLKRMAWEVSSTKENALEFLKTAGIMTKDGELHPRYK